MAQFYSVAMVRKHVIRKYDEHGVFVAETTEEIPLVFNDLPFATAMAYQTKFPDSKVKITEQAAGSIDHGARSKIGGFATMKRRRRGEFVPITDASPPTIPSHDSHFSAAATGDMAAAINEEIKERS